MGGACVTGQKTFTEQQIRRWLRDYHELDVVYSPVRARQSFIGSRALRVDHPSNKLIRRMEIDMAIASLPVKLAKVVFLRYVADWPIDTIVRWLGCSRATVVRRIDEGIERITEWFNERYPWGEE